MEVRAILNALILLLFVELVKASFLKMNDFLTYLQSVVSTQMKDKNFLKLSASGMIFKSKGVVNQKHVL